MDQLNIRKISTIQKELTGAVAAFKAFPSEHNMKTVDRLEDEKYHAIIKDKKLRSANEGNNQ